MLYRGASGKVVALRRPLLPPRGAAVDGPDRGRRYPLHVSRHEVRYLRQVHPDPRPGRDSAKARRAQLSGGRALQSDLDLDGRRREGRSGPDRRLSAARRSQMARALPGYMHYKANWLLDRRQSQRLRPSRLRAHKHARRLRGICLQDQAGRGGKAGRRLSRRALAHECRAAAATTRR